MPFIIFLVIAGFIGLVVFGIYSSIAKAGKADEAWSEVGKRLNLRNSKDPKGKRKLFGRLDGYDLKVSTITRSSGKSKSTFTRYELRFGKEFFNYNLTRSKALSGVATFFGAQDIEIGAEEFDRGVVVKSNRPKQIKSFLTPERQNAVMHLLLTYPGAVVQNGEVEWEQSGVTSSAAQIEGVLRRFVRLAQVMDGVELTQPEPATTSRRKHGSHKSRAAYEREHSSRKDLDVHVPGVHGKAEPRVDEGPIFELPPVYEPPTVERQQQAAEQITNLGENLAPKRQAREVAPGSGEAKTGPVLVDSANQVDLPERTGEKTADRLETSGRQSTSLQVTELGGVSSLAPSTLEESAARGAPASGRESGEPHQLSELIDPDRKLVGLSIGAAGVDLTYADEPGAADGSTSLDMSAAEVCEDLFAENAMGSKINSEFEQHYDNAIVTWEGKLERLDSYYSDMVFGSKPGTKAQLILHQIEGGYGARTAEGMLQLDPETADALRNRVGESIRFRGRLVKCEAFMRRLMIADGEIL